MSNLKNISDGIIKSAINAVKPDLLIQRRIKLEEAKLAIGMDTFDLDAYQNVFLIGAGKASALMAQSVESLLQDRITGGCVTVKYGYQVDCRTVEILQAGHPVIDQNSLDATEKMLHLIQAAGKNDLVICLISGGGSALLEKLPQDILLSDLQKVFELLLGCGANIEEINTVRKHLSLVKGGQLARAVSPATCVSVILSDVIGDPLGSIASGPTAPDPTTFSDAWEVISKYGLEAVLPRAVSDHIRYGVKGRVQETLKSGDPIFENTFNIILGNNFEALKAAQSEAENHGFNTLILTSRLQGEAREIAKVIAGIVQDILDSDFPVNRPACLLMGGESTVTLRGKGEGGRNQELALAALQEMKNVKGDYLIVSCGTDGSDGPTDAAGGMASPEIWRKSIYKEMNPQKYLGENNAYPFLKATNGLIKTGPTGTNVMDIIFALIP